MGALVHWMLTLHPDFISLLDDLVVEEKLRVDFVRGGEDEVLAVLALEGGNGQGVDELALVHVVACPASGLREQDRDILLYKSFIT
jgi:hypothetical protein